MPKKSGRMNEREQAICARVKALREERGLSQPELAGQMGITLARLAGVEYGRAPLKFLEGNFLCAAYDLNQRYLATGEKPKEFCVPFADAVFQIPPNALYSEAYDLFLQPWIEQSLDRIARRLKCKVQDIDSLAARALPLDEKHAVLLMDAEDFRLILDRMMRASIEQLPASVYFRFYSGLRGFQNKWFKAHAEFITTIRKGAEVLAERRAVQDAQKEKVDSAYAMRNNAGMKAQWPALLKDVIARTDSRGMKAALAKALGVAPPRINEWVNGTGTPTAEVALKLRKLFYEDGWPANRKK